MELLQKNKYTLGLAITLVIAFIAYLYFRTNDATAPLLQPIDAGATADVIAGQQILSTLGELENLKLDEKKAVFNDPVFKSLEDFKLATTSEPLGRENPFAPIEGQATSRGR